MGISTTIDDGIAEVVMDNPPVNALTVAGWFELADTVRGLGGDPLVDPQKHRMPGPHPAAVHVNGEDPLGSLLDLRKDLPHAGGLPAPRRAAEHGIERAGARERRADGGGQRLHLALPVGERLGDVVGHKDAGIVKEPVPAIPHG